MDTITTSIGIKKMWMAPLLTGGAQGTAWRPIQDGGLEGTGELMRESPSKTTYKNWAGIDIEEKTVEGSMMLNARIADVSLETIAFLNGGTITQEVGKPDVYTPPADGNVNQEKSVMILTDKNVLLIIPRVSYTAIEQLSDSDIHTMNIEGKVFKPYVESYLYQRINLTAVEAAKNEIESFVLAEQTGDATIDTTAKTVAIEVENGTDVTSLVPTIGLSYGAGIKPYSGNAQDFTSPVDYVVQSADGTEVVYTVTVTVAS